MQWFYYVIGRVNMLCLQPAIRQTVPVRATTMDLVLATDLVQALTR
jgi:hypothetical protein